jgi:hypothetical protein
MRLSIEQVEIIKHVVEETLGDSARFYLFGSRVGKASAGD